MPNDQQPMNAVLPLIPRQGDWVLGQVAVRRSSSPGTFEMRHTGDLNREPASLTSVTSRDLRRIAMHDRSGRFRPLRSAPDLVDGWLFLASDPRMLEEGLNEVYPGAIADLHACAQADLPVTHYREYCQRQTGMYRITALLPDPEAARVARACCHPRFCLKRRLWTVPGLAADDPAAGSTIPCLEPCALLMELARKAFKVGEEEAVTVTLRASELESIRAAVEASIQQPGGTTRHADYSAPDNARRLHWVLGGLP